VEVEEGRGSMKIRLAEPGDEMDIRDCVRSAYELYVERMGKEPAPMLDDYAALIERGVVSVAVSDESLVGLIVGWPRDDHFYVDNIAVSPDAQGTGVGATLLRHADAMALAADRTEVRLYTNEAMSENIGYYPRKGFVETHRAVEAGYNRVYYTRSVPAP
jgi:ribosomal protein S18 acetylase RimI-like enzyme